jgi:hypothetical protein
MRTAFSPQIFFLNHHNLANSRSPLTEINGNKIPRVEHSEYIRGQMVGLWEGGLTLREVSAKLQLAKSTCQSIFYRKDSTPNGKSAPRSGRPRLWSKCDERKLIRTVRIKQDLTYSQLIRNRARFINQNHPPHSRHP